MQSKVTDLSRGNAQTLDDKIRRTLLQGIDVKLNAFGIEGGVVNRGDGQRDMLGLGGQRRRSPDEQDQATTPEKFPWKDSGRRDRIRW